MNYFGGRPQFRTPPVVLNLIIINVVIHLVTLLVYSRFPGSLANTVISKSMLYFPASENFMPHQLVTYMFMHSPNSFMHLFFNMFALWMFGRTLEQVWGGKRFLIYYMVTGIGAGLLHILVNYIQFTALKANLTPDQLNMVLNEGANVISQSKMFKNPEMQKLNVIINTPTIGASGSVFGVLLAFGMLFPNSIIMLLFPPIPLKAKWFVIIYGAAELIFGLTSVPGDNVAHFAHLGGMLFGFILIKIWKQNRNNFY